MPGGRARRPRLPLTAPGNANNLFEELTFICGRVGGILNGEPILPILLDIVSV